VKLKKVNVLLSLPLLKIWFILPAGSQDFNLRRVREVVPTLTLELIDGIIFQYNLESEVEEAAEEAVHDYSQVIELHKLTQAVVLMIAKQLPQYQDIEIEDYLGKLNAWEITVIEDTYEVFEELNPELVEEVKAVFIRGLPEWEIRPELEKETFQAKVEKFKSREESFTPEVEKFNFSKEGFIPEPDSLAKVIFEDDRAGALMLPCKGMVWMFVP
jgi:phage baseplate assembly protein W